MQALPRLCEFYPGICLTTEEKARKNLSQGKKNLSQVKKNLSQVKKNLSQSTVYILPKHPHFTKPSQTHTLQNPHIHTHTHLTHIINNIKTPQYNIYIYIYIYILFVSVSARLRLIFRQSLHVHNYT